jgi:N5-(cytidine 5'-diphosphoramidyl)-L-glutamine hydrolase
MPKVQRGGITPAPSRIVLTQRVLWHKQRPYDCLDHVWYRFFGAHHLVAAPNIHPNPASLLDGADLLILTGGNPLDADDPHLPGEPGLSPNRNRTEDALLARALASGIPIFGICRGFQALVRVFGGRLVPTDGHMDVDHMVSADGGSFHVNSHHAIAVETPPVDTVVLARDQQGRCESFVHASLPVGGTMWHPERMAVPFIPVELGGILPNSVFSTSAA